MKGCFVFLLILGALGIGGAYGAQRWNTQRLARNLQATSQRVVDYKITVIEGKRREEIALQLEALDICSATDFLAASANKEGRLFPDTYRFFKNTPASQIVQKMTTTFAERTANSNPSPEQIILASIVEREARGDADRAIIAGIYSNRLARGMTLDADPTVQYAKESITPPTSTYWNPITQSDYLAVSSTYNTYTHKGLPPGPIANPGLPSLLAAIHPSSTPYLYFLHKNGILIPARTLAEQTSHE